MLFDQHDQSSRNEKLVGNRIEKFTKRRDLIAAACKLAVYLHGTAGDLAEADEGEVALVASDMATRLGDAVMELTARRQVKRES